MRNLDICLSPDLLHLFDLENKIVVVVDILRATSCMVTGFAHGIDSIIPVAKLEDCKKLQLTGLKAAAERDGMKVEGFDLDNSPFSYMAKELIGKEIAMTTTNGTQAIDKSKKASKIVIGAFLNIDSVARYLSEQEHDVIIVCAGWKGNFNLEDTLFAGALGSKIKANFEISQDATIASIEMYESNKQDLLSFVNKSQHVRRLAGLGISKDIEFCLSFDKYDVVPVFEGDRLKNIKSLVLN
jgi:2-phosphosulfolactate phosphatase